MKRIMLAVLLFSATAAHAAGTWTNGLQVISNVIWRPGYHGFYVTAASFHNPQGCPNVDLYLFDPSLDDQTVAFLYGVMMTAFAKQKTLHVFVDGCQQGVPNVTGLQVNQ